MSEERILWRMHVAIIGAGIVGCAVAYHLLKVGIRVTIVHRDPNGDKASFGNAGAIAVTEIIPAAAPTVWLQVFRWMFDPLGPLAVRPAHTPSLIPWLVHFAKSSVSTESKRISSAIAAINSRVYDDLVPMLVDTGSESELQGQGALTLYETEAGFRRDEADWKCKRSHNIIVEELSGADVRRMEPDLGPLIHRAMWTPQWSHVGDPERLVRRLLEWLVGCGASVHAAEVDKIRAPTGSFCVYRVRWRRPVTCRSSRDSRGRLVGAIGQTTW